MFCNMIVVFSVSFSMLQNELNLIKNYGWRVKPGFHYTQVDGPS